MRLALLLTAVGAASPAWGQESPHFAVVDLTPAAGHDKIVAELERSVQRLKPDMKPIDDASMKRLLATGEGPAAAAVRLTREAQQLRGHAECAPAVAAANQAEALTLASVSLDDERELLRSIYVVLVSCEHELGHTKERDTAARRLRDLVSLLPTGLTQELWDAHVKDVVAGTPTTPIYVDSDPGNAQISINFRGVGITPHALKVVPGTVYVEVQKDGYKKAFRKLEVGTLPTRTAFRLIARTQDRMDQALSTLTILRGTDAAGKLQALSRLANLARADGLVLLEVTGDRARVRFFDAEKGGLGSEALVSPIDPETGRLTAMAEIPKPSVNPDAPPSAGILSPTSKSGLPAGKKAQPPGLSMDAPDIQAPRIITRKEREPAPWWGWLIAAAIGGSLLTYIYLDRPQRKDTLAVRATWTPPSP